MTDKIFFFHNPKAGGSSLRRVFGDHFSAEKQCPIIENDKVGHEQLSGEYAPFCGYDYYFGHYGYDIFEVVNDGHSCVTNFRDPVGRLMSLYNFFKFNVQLSEEELRTERFRAVAFAKSASFEEFVSSEDPNIEVYVRNAHFRQLANSCWILDATKGFDEVCQFVDQMRWYYVCEYPQLSVNWLRRAFDWDVTAIPRENITRTQNSHPISLATLDDRVLKIISTKNELDFALYRHAVRRLMTEVTDHPSGLRNVILQRTRSVIQLFARKRLNQLDQ